MNIFSKIYIGLWLALVAVEIFAATTSYTPLDTMSENYWYLQGKFPPLAVITTIGMLVLWYHLVLSKGVIK
jgi:FtsH-binding integral membrane protein